MIIAIICTIHLLFGINKLLTGQCYCKIMHCVEIIYELQKIHILRLIGITGKLSSSLQNNAIKLLIKLPSCTTTRLTNSTFSYVASLSFDNSQRQAKYFHLKCLASLNIYSRIIDLPSPGVGLRSVHSPQWVLHESPDTELELCHYLN